MIDGCKGVKKVTYGVETDKYIVPETITAKINSKIRDEKQKEIGICEELYEKAKFEMPGASEARLNAIVYRRLQDIKHGKKEEHDPELTFKPNCTRSQKSKAPAPPKPARRTFLGSTGSRIIGGSQNSMQKSNDNVTKEVKEGEESEGSEQ